MENATEPTAERLWDDVSGRLREALNETTYATWFGDASAGDLSDDTFSLVVPNDFTREWIEGHFLGFVKAAARDALGARRPRDAHRPRARAAPRRERRRRRCPRRRRRARRPGAGEPEVHVRPLRDRVVEPLRACRRARGRRGAGPGLQPALHLRRHRARQDAPPAGDRPVRERAHEGLDDAVRDERDLHERLHQLAPRQADRGLQAALPHLRRPSRRRHPVLRGQGADPGGVLPHVQLALRGRPPDRDLVRPAAEGDRNARGAACGRGSSGA